MKKGINDFAENAEKLDSPIKIKKELTKQLKTCVDAREMKELFNYARDMMLNPNSKYGISTQ